MPTNLFQEGFVDVFTTDVGMNENELNTRAFLSTLKQSENAGNAPLGYNVLYTGITFTEHTYEEAPGDYAAHPPGFVEGSSAAGKKPE